VTKRGSGDSKVGFGVAKRKKPRVAGGFDASVQKVESAISFGRTKLWRLVADRPVCRFFRHLNRGVHVEFRPSDSARRLADANAAAGHQARGDDVFLVKIAYWIGR
jgi:hypothetical protein